MFFDFHTHAFVKNALVSSGEKPVDAAYWSLEVHPWNLPETFVPFDENFFSKLSSAAALGEIGLDRLKGPDLSIQREYFRTLLSAAQRLGKPVVIHSVRCDAELDAELKHFSGRVMIHGFRGGNKRLLEHLQLGRFVSFAPGGWRHCLETLQSSGLRNIGLETDDSGLCIDDIYRQAESETGISDWEKLCENNFLRFIGVL